MAGCRSHAGLRVFLCFVVLLLATPGSSALEHAPALPHHRLQQATQSAVARSKRTSVVLSLLLQDFDEPVFFGIIANALNLPLAVTVRADSVRETQGSVVATLVFESSTSGNEAAVLAAQNALIAQANDVNSNLVVAAPYVKSSCFEEGTVAPLCNAVDRDSKKEGNLTNTQITFIVLGLMLVLCSLFLGITVLINYCHKRHEQNKVKKRKQKSRSTSGAASPTKAGTYLASASPAKPANTAVARQATVVESGKKSDPSELSSRDEVPLPRVHSNSMSAKAYPMHSQFDDVRNAVVYRYGSGAEAVDQAFTHSGAGDNSTDVDGVLFVLASAGVPPKEGEAFVNAIPRCPANDRAIDNMSLLVALGASPLSWTPPVTGRQFTSSVSPTDTRSHRPQPSPLSDIGAASTRQKTKNVLKFKEGDEVDAEFHGTWYPAVVLSIESTSAELPSGGYVVMWTEDGSRSLVQAEDVRERRHSARASSPSVTAKQRGSVVDPQATTASSPTTTAGEYKAGEPVTVFWYGEWYEGTVHSREHDGTYNVYWGDDTGSQGIRASDIRPMAVPIAASCGMCGSGVEGQPHAVTRCKICSSAIKLVPPG